MKVFLPRFADDGGREHRVTAPRGVLTWNGIVVLERVVAVVIAEGPFGLPLLGRHLADEREFGSSDERVRPRAFAIHSFSPRMSDAQLGNVLRQRRDGGRDQPAARQNTVTGSARPAASAT